MIQLIDQGDFKLYKTKNNTEILVLDKVKFAWVDAGKLGDILVPSKVTNGASSILSVGKFRLYDVKNEDKLTDLMHLELFVGGGVWQGYLLPTGLPKKSDKNRIIATKESITRITH